MRRGCAKKVCAHSMVTSIDQVVLRGSSARIRASNSGTLNGLVT
jgi:hypothetical protein